MTNQPESPKKKRSLLTRLFGQNEIDAASGNGKRKLMFETLEARVLYSAAPVDGGVEAEAPESSPAAEAEHVATVTPTDPNAETQQSAEGTLTPEPVRDEEGVDQVFASPDEIPTDSSAEVADAPADDSVLTSEDLSPLIEEAIARWTETGLTEEQAAALLNVTYEVVDLESNALGVTDGFVIRIDDDAAGSGWFLDETPTLDEEFQFVSGTETQMVAEMDSLAEDRFDLLTVLMHEQGHILGLADATSDQFANLMSGILEAGERLTPAEAQAEGATAGSLEGERFALTTSTISGGTLSIVGDGADDAVILQLNGANYEISTDGGANFTTVTSDGSPVANISIDLGGGNDSVIIDSDIDVTGTVTITSTLITLNGEVASDGDQDYSGRVRLGANGSIDAGGTLTTSSTPSRVLVGYDFDNGGSTLDEQRAATVTDANVSASLFDTGAGLITRVDSSANSASGANDAEGFAFGTANDFSFGGAQSNFGFADQGNGDNLDSGTRNAVAQDDYMTFSVTPAPGNQMNLTSFSFLTRVNTTGNSAERWALFASTDGFATAPATGNAIAIGQTTTVTTFVSNVVDLSAAEFQGITSEIEFRLYIYGGNNSSSSATQFDKVILNGNTSSLNNAPVATNDTATVTEAGGYQNNIAGSDASGNVITDATADSDADAGDTLSITEIDSNPVAANTTSVDGTLVAGTYGSLRIGADGSWTYTVDQSDADTEALATGDSPTEVFTYTLSDGTDTATATLTVTVNGADDAVSGILYVDGSWSGLNAGDRIEDADAGTTGDQLAFFNGNAFATIGDAIANAGTGDTIVVNAGTYDETVVLNDGKTLEITGPNVDQAVTVTELSSDVGTTITIEGGSTLTFANTTEQTIAGTVEGSGSLVASNTANLFLSGANTYAGGTTLTDGSQLTASNTSALGSGTATLTGTGVSLIFGVDGTFANAIETLDNGDDKSITAASGTNVVLTGDINLNDGSAPHNRFAVEADATLLVNGLITAGSGFNQISGNSASELILTNASNAIGGTINIEADGRLVVRNSGAAGTAEIRIDALNATLVLGDGVDLANTVEFGQDETTKFIRLEDGATSATISGTFQIFESNVNSNRIVLETGQTLEISGPVTRVNSGRVLNLFGDGTLILSNSSIAINEEIDVRSGTLILNGTQLDFGLTVYVRTGATLGGTGSIQGTGSNGNATILGTLLGDTTALDGTGTLTINTGATLDLTSADVSSDAASYSLATFSSVVGTFDNVVGLPSGYEVEYTATGVNLVKSNQAPTITSSDTVNFAENGVGTVIDVQSTDTEGSTEGAGLTYTISGGADSARFDIDANTGVLTFKSAPDFEAPSDANTDNDYLVQITVTDDGGLTDVQDLTVSVTNLDEAPSITSGATANFAENGTGTVIDVESTDPEGSTEGSGLTYSISGGADSALFGIDANTGELTFNSAPDFEVPADSGSDNVYNVQVQVSDGTNDVTQDIAVTVTNVDEAPSITSGATANFAENGTGTVIDVQSTDPEGSTEGSGLTYSISGGADSALFGIDANTGELTFNSAPDFEVPADSGSDNVYNVQVQVSDGTNDVTQDMAVTVTNVNEAPVNTVPGAQSVNEDTALAIGGVSVNDVDGNLAAMQVSVTNGTLSVTLSGAATISAGANNSATVTISGSETDINATLASLSYQGNLDFAGNDTLSLVSTDSGGTPLSDTDAVAITVNPVNDAPVLTGDLVANIQGGSTYTISASDLGYSDPDDIDAGVTFTAGSAVNGKIQVGGVDANSFTGTQLAAGDVTFVHDGTQANSASFTVNVEDGNEDGSPPTNSTFNFVVTPASSVVLAGYDFTTDNTATTADGVSASAVTGAGGFSNAGVVGSIGDTTQEAASGTPFGSSSTGSYGDTNDGIDGNNLAQAITGQDYITVTITAESGNTLTVTGFSVDTARAGGRSPESYNILAQVNGGTTWDASGALTTNQETLISQATTDWHDTFIDLSGDPTFQEIQSVEFRIYFWGASGSTNSSRINIDQLVVEGTVNPINTGGETTTSPTVVKTETDAGTVTGSQNVAKALDPQGAVGNALSALDSLVSLFNSFQSNAGDFSGRANQVSSGIFIFSITPLFADDGTLQDGFVSLGFTGTSQSGNEISITGQFNPLSTVNNGFNFQGLDGTPMTVVEVYQALLRPVYNEEYAFGGPLEGDDEERDRYTYVPTASETEEVLAATEANPESQTDFSNLLDAVQSTEASSIFAGVQVGETFEDLVPVLAGSGIPGEELILRVNGNRYHVIVDEHGNWMNLFPDEKLPPGSRVEVASAHASEGARVYEVDSFDTENVLEQDGDVKSGDMLGQIVDAVS
tara:strand:+ start:6505 stop:13509 length:7005 start_codon:yes stop_codon:yes gene_type:complete